jgi:histidine triad (HIT) family protein
MGVPSDCIFCRIGAGQIPAKVVWQDEDIFAFEDLNPQAPVHVLVIPKRHFVSLNDMTNGGQHLLGRLVEATTLVAKNKGIAESGYRVVANTGANGGQTVLHLHLHVLGGRQMKWPPG